MEPYIYLNQNSNNNYNNSTLTLTVPSLVNPLTYNTATATMGMRGIKCGLENQGSDLNHEHINSSIGAARFKDLP